MKWEQIRKIHSSASAAFAAAAEGVSSEKWTVPRAEGKWSAAEIVEHLNLAYATLLRELTGGKGMQIRTKLWQRLLLRITLVPKLLRGEPFPANARAPREMRPASADPDPASAIARFREQSSRFEAVAHEAITRGRSPDLTHAYFGTASLATGVLLCARHVQHHEKQLQECGS